MVFMGIDDPCRGVHMKLLPVEIQCHIFKQIPDLQTLKALVRTCHHFRDVYQTFQSTILPCVASNHRIWPLAIHACELRSRRPKPRGNALIPFIEKISPAPVETPRSISCETAKALFRFEDTLDYLIGYYTRDRFAFIQNELSSSHSVNVGTLMDYAPVSRGSQALSSTERSRLTRAFYRLEVYSCFFTKSVCDHQRRAETFIKEKSAGFLSHIKDWELEEMLCVRGFLLERLAAFVDQVEDDFMEEYQQQEPRYIERRSGDSRWECEDEFFSDDFKTMWQDDWIEGCLGRGLDRIKKMLQADTQAKRYDTLGGMTRPGVTMRDCLKGLPTDEPGARSEEPRNLWPHADFHDEPHSYGFGWLWLDHEWRSRDLHGTYPECQRRWGYIFWDRERLERLRTVSEPDINAFVNPQSVEKDSHSLSCPWVDPWVRSNDNISRSSHEKYSRHSLSVEFRTRKQEEIWKKEGNMSERPYTGIHEWHWDNASDWSSCDLNSDEEEGG